jgi:hypothetical protein
MDKLKMQLYIVAIFFTVTFVSCKSSSNKTQDKSSQVSFDTIPSVITQHDSLDAIVKSIIDISANDFYKHQQPLPTAFRNVQLKYSVKPNKEILFILCGQFTVEDAQKSDKWIHFTTIKNSNYEQWIGPNGLTYCENSKEIPYAKADLSIELRNRFFSLQKTKK